MGLARNYSARRKSVVVDVRILRGTNSRSVIWPRTILFCDGSPPLRRDRQSRDSLWARPDSDLRFQLPTSRFGGESIRARDLHQARAFMAPKRRRIYSAISARSKRDWFASDRAPVGPASRD